MIPRTPIRRPVTETDSGHTDPSDLISLSPLNLLYTGLQDHDSLLLSPTCATTRYRRLHSPTLEANVLPDLLQLKLRSSRSAPQLKTTSLSEGNLSSDPCNEPKTPSSSRETMQMALSSGTRARFHPYQTPITPSRFVTNGCGTHVLSPSNKSFDFFTAEWSPSQLFMPGHSRTSSLRSTVTADSEAESISSGYVTTPPPISTKVFPKPPSRADTGAKRSATNVASSDVPSEGESGEVFTRETVPIAELFDSRGNLLDCDIRCVTHSCFIVVDGKWACYRRNYLKIDASLILPATLSSSLFFREPHASSIVQLSHFSFGLSAHISDKHGRLGAKQVPLVQFGPARERGPRSEVRLQPLTETTVPFRRVQIRQATQNNGYKGSSGQQYYVLKVTLYAHPKTQSQMKTGGIAPVPIAYTLSQPVTVRGRSKMHYAPPGKSSVPFPSVKDETKKPFNVMAIQNLI